MLAGRTVLVAINLLFWTAVLLAITQFYQTTTALPLTSIRSLHILAFRFDPVLYTLRHNSCIVKSARFSNLGIHKANKVEKMKRNAKKE